MYKKKKPLLKTALHFVEIQRESLQHFRASFETICVSGTLTPPKPLSLVLAITDNLRRYWLGAQQLQRAYDQETPKTDARYL